MKKASIVTPADDSYNNKQLCKLFKEEEAKN